MSFPCVRRSFQLIVFNQPRKHYEQSCWSVAVLLPTLFISYMTYFQTWFLRSRPHERISFDCFKSLRSICSLTVIMERLIQWLYVFSGLDFFFPFSILWVKMKEEPNYSRIKLLYMKDISLWLWTLISLENTETIILIYHAGSDDAMCWMKGGKTIITYIRLVRK